MESSSPLPSGGNRDQEQEDHDEDSALPIQSKKRRVMHGSSLRQEDHERKDQEPKNFDSALPIQVKKDQDGKDDEAALLPTRAKGPVKMEVISAHANPKQESENSDSTPPTESNMTIGNGAHQISLHESAMLELVMSGRLSDIQFLASWLYRKEKESYMLYVQNEATLRDEVSWKDTCFVKDRYTSQKNSKRDRARRTTLQFMLINSDVRKHMKRLVDQESSSQGRRTAVYYLYDLARLNPKMLIALSESWEVISVLLIILLTEVCWAIHLDIMVVLGKLSELYMGKLLIGKLGGFQILTQAKKEAFLLLSSLCQASENVGCFLKDGVAEAALLELSGHGSRIVDEFTILVTSLDSEVILERFMMRSHRLQAGPERSYAHHRGLSIIQMALQVEVPRIGLDPTGEELERKEKCF